MHFSECDGVQLVELMGIFENNYSYTKFNLSTINEKRQGCTSPSGVTQKSPLTKRYFVEIHSRGRRDAKPELSPYYLQQFFSGHGTYCDTGEAPNKEANRIVSITTSL